MAESSESKNDDSNVVVLNEIYCVPEDKELTVKQGMNKRATYLIFEVHDTDDKSLLVVEGFAWRVHKKCVMRGPLGFPLITLKQEGVMKKHLWVAYRGDSTENKDFLFRAHTKSRHKLGTRMEVFLADHPYTEDAPCDFYMNAEIGNHSFVVNQGEKIIAQADHKFTWKSFLMAEETIKYKVSKGVDYTFAISLLVVMFLTDGGL